MFLRTILVLLLLVPWSLALPASDGTGEGPTVAVLPFEDRSASALMDVEMGLGRMLAGKLSLEGYSVIPPDALVSWAGQRGLNPRDRAVLHEAAADLGATHIAKGTLEWIRASSVRLSLGPLVIEGAHVRVKVSLELLSLPEGKVLGEFEAEGEGQGKAGLSIDLSFFISLPGNVCAGGFRSNKGVYLSGEPVILGYLDPNPWMAPNSFYVVIEPLGGSPPSWTSALETSAPGDECVTWTWGQMFGMTPASPGLYRAYLYDDTSALISTLTFEILPTPAPWAVEIRVGTPEFRETAWYAALSEALDELVEGIRGIFPLPEG